MIEQDFAQPLIEGHKRFFVTTQKAEPYSCSSFSTLSQCGKKDRCFWGKNKTNSIELAIVHAHPLGSLVRCLEYDNVISVSLCILWHSQ